MKFKKDRLQVEWDIAADAEAAAKYSLQNDLGGSPAMGPVTDAVSKAIGQAVRAAFRTLLDNQYTDDDFEKDIGLKP